MRVPLKAVVHTVRDGVRSQLWPVPVAGVVIAIVLGILLPHVDARIDAQLPTGLLNITFGGDPDAARTVLSAVSSSLITVTSLTFSLTVITLQLASSQFSPRLLRTFTQDQFVQTTLGLFLATFTYSLTVLRSVRTGGQSSVDFVPRIAVTVSYLLALASVVALVLFLAHLARQIRVETVLRNVHQEATATVAANLQARPEPGEGSDPLPTPPSGAHWIFARKSGFCLSLEENALAEAAAKAGALVWASVLPGAFVVAGTPIAQAWGEENDLEPDVLDELRRRVVDAVRIGIEPTAAQDVGYGLRQLTDVATKALSPGINDPTTAIHALGHISALLTELCGRQLGPHALYDSDDRLRVVANRPSLADLLDASITQPRRYGASDPQVAERLYQLLIELAWHAPPAEIPHIHAQLERLISTTKAQDFDSHEMAIFDVLARRVREIRAAP